MDEAYARAYGDLYRTHWWWRAREHLLLREIRKLASGRRDLRILDVGCGSGLFFDRLSEFGDVEGIETDPMLARADARHRHRIHVGDLSSYRPSARFDLILLLDVLEHLEDPRDVLGRSFSLLKPGGGMLITVPAFMFLWTHHDVVNQHRTRFTRVRLERLIRSAGGSVVDSRYFFHWTVPVKLAVRAKERILGKSDQARLPPYPINRSLYSLSRIEERWFGWLRLPFGSSLLAHCRRADV